MTTLPAFRPLGDRVLVRRTGAEERTPGGLIIPQTARDKLHSGEVLRTGPDVKAAELVEGVTVVFGKYSEDEIELEGEKFCVLREDRIFGVMEPDIVTGGLTGACTSCGGFLTYKEQVLDTHTCPTGVSDE